MTTAPLRFARQHGLPFLADHALPTEWPTLPIPLDYWQRHGMLPLRLTESTLATAVASVSALRMTQELAFITHRQITPYWCSSETLTAGLQAFARSHDRQRISAPSTQEEDALSDVRQILISAHEQRASDIHFDPTPLGHLQRFRIDGYLHTTATWAREKSERLIRQLKLLASLDCAQARQPQDGALRLTLHNGGHTSLRISTLPALNGEKVVLRFIPIDSALGELASAGLSPCQYRQLIEAISRRTGLVLVTGPTGSGKTSTLYRLMMAIAQRHQLNLCSVEDPVEAQLQGVNQIQVNGASGLGFAPALRALLRQDPDVIMVGEIRDSETARMAMRAAQTGHLVLSTLHTGSAAATLARLHALGIPRHDLVSALSLVLSQRLVRQLCPHCRQTDTPPMSLKTRYPLLRNTPLYQAGPGCTHCREGYQGRLALFEMAVVTSNIRNALLDTSALPSINLTETSTLQDAALKRLVSGDTALKEVLDILGAEILDVFE